MGLWLATLSLVGGAAGAARFDDGVAALKTELSLLSGLEDDTEFLLGFHRWYHQLTGQEVALSKAGQVALVPGLVLSLKESEGSGPWVFRRDGAREVRIAKGPSLAYVTRDGLRRLAEAENWRECEGVLVLGDEFGVTVTLLPSLRKLRFHGGP